MPGLDDFVGIQPIYDQRIATAAAANDPENWRRLATSLVGELKQLKDGWHTLNEDNLKLRRDFAKSLRNHGDDIQLISEWMGSFAKAEGRCERFNEIIDNLNRTLHIQLPALPSHYLVELTVRIHVDAVGNAHAQEAAIALLRSAANAADLSIDVEATGTEEDDE